MTLCTVKWCLICSLRDNDRSKNDLFEGSHLLLYPVHKPPLHNQTVEQKTALNHYFYTETWGKRFFLRWRLLLLTECIPSCFHWWQQSLSHQASDRAAESVQTDPHQWWTSNPSLLGRSPKSTSRSSSIHCPKERQQTAFTKRKSSRLAVVWRTWLQMFIYLSVAIKSHSQQTPCPGGWSASAASSCRKAEWRRLARTQTKQFQDLLELFARNPLISSLVLTFEQCLRGNSHEHTIRQHLPSSSLPWYTAMPATRPMNLK